MQIRLNLENSLLPGEARLQDKKNRQNSIGIDSESDLHYEWQMKQQKVIDVAKETYEWAIQAGIAKEQARVVLPKATTKTRLYMNGTLRSWVHYNLTAWCKWYTKRAYGHWFMLVQK